MDLRVDGPCGEDWDAMEPRPGGRFCASCRHTVLDLDGLSRAQVEARLARARGRTCVRFPVDERGAPIFRPGPSRARTAAGGLVLASALTAGGCAATEPPEAPVVVAVEEPPVDAGPPMMPVDPTDAGAESCTTGPVAADLAPGSGEPTPEQRRLTEEKHRPPVMHMHTMGIMYIPPSVP